MLSERYEMNLLSVEGVSDIPPSSVCIGVAWGRMHPPHIFFYLRIFFLATDCKRGNQKESEVTVGGKGMYVY